jgi:hypothetical protein
MSKEEQRSHRRGRVYAPSARAAAKRTEELMNHPSFKYTFINQQIRSL